MEKVTDAQLDQQIKAANERLEKLQQQKEARLQSRRNQLAKHLEERYGVTTIQELESLLHPSPNPNY